MLIDLPVASFASNHMKPVIPTSDISGHLIMFAFGEQLDLVVNPYTRPSSPNITDHTQRLL